MPSGSRLTNPVTRTANGLHLNSSLRITPGPPRFPPKSPVDNTWSEPRLWPCTMPINLSSTLPALRSMSRTVEAENFLLRNWFPFLVFTKVSNGRISGVTASISSQSLDLRWFLSVVPEIHLSPRLLRPHRLRLRPPALVLIPQASHTLPLASPPHPRMPTRRRPRVGQSAPSALRLLDLRDAVVFTNLPTDDPTNVLRFPFHDFMSPRSCLKSTSFAVRS